MRFYKVIDNNDNEIGKATSYDLRYAQNGHILFCMENLAQYIKVHNVIYRIPWLNLESPDMEGKFPIANMMEISQEEYEQ